MALFLAQPLLQRGSSLGRPHLPLNRLHIPDHPAKITAGESSEQWSAPDMHHRMESLEPSEADIIIIPNLQARKLGHRESCGC